jgi:hypothetical protein
MISTAEAATRLDLSLQRVRALCTQRRIKGAKLIGRSWFVPNDFEVTPGTRGPKPKGGGR